MKVEINIFIDSVVVSYEFIVEVFSEELLSFLEM